MLFIARNTDNLSLSVQLSIVSESQLRLDICVSGSQFIPITNMDY